MTASGIPAIDNLLDGAGGPITSTSDKAAIGAVQDLLRGHNQPGMPTLTSSLYGKFGPKTRTALLGFCRKYCPQSIVANQVTEVSKVTLKALIDVKAVNPIASQVYVTRKLDLPYKGFNRLSCIVAVGEGKGEFAALCENDDKAGLSLGMIQWAQRPVRLNELLNAIPKEKLKAALGSDKIVTDVLTHTALVDKPKRISGGVNIDTGKPTDPAMDLAENDWPAKFLRLCLDPDVQKIQVEHAAAGFKQRKGKFDAVLADPKSERLVAYLLDLVNQFEGFAPDFLQKAVNDGGLPATLKERDAELIDRTTKYAKEKLRKIGETILPSGSQKWPEAFILKVQTSRTNRGAFIKTWKGLEDTPFSE